MKKRIIPILTIFLITILAIVVTRSKENNLKDSGNYLAVLIDGNKSTSFPSKGNYQVNTICTNGSASWDYENWNLKVIPQNGKTKCEIRFETNAAVKINEYLKSLAPAQNVSMQNGSDSESYFVHENLDLITNSLTSEKDKSYYTGYTETTTTPNYTWDATNYTWTSNNNKKDSTTATMIFYPASDGNAALCYTISSEKNADIATIYMDDTKITSVSGSDSGCLYFNDLKTTNKMTISYVKDSSASSGNDNIIFSMKGFDSSSVPTDVGYRFQGPNPNNYVIFNDELWRIIGVFDENTHGITNEWLVKIIKNTSVKALNWSTSNAAVHFKNTPVNTFLNTNYYNDTTDNGQGIKSKYQNYIENASWYLGTIDEDVTALKAFVNERNHFVYSDTSLNIISNPIGLMYLSDYGLAVSKENTSCTREAVLKYYSAVGCADKSWLAGNPEEWTISQQKNNSYTYVYSPSDAGSIISSMQYNYYQLRPTLYLKSNVKKIAGNGSIDNPYILTYEGE